MNLVNMPHSYRIQLKMSAWQKRTLREMFGESHRPDLVAHYNNNPELVDSLIARANENMRGYECDFILKFQNV